MSEVGTYTAAAEAELAVENAALRRLRGAISTTIEFIAKEYRAPALEPEGEWLAPEARPVHAALCAALTSSPGPYCDGIYVASRASVPERAAEWRRLRDQGWPIVATWIDEAGEGETGDFGELWARIQREVTGAAALIVYAEPGDFPLKGALVEVGMALAAGVPVYAVLPGVELEPRSMRPAGSWLAHPGVAIVPNLAGALAAIIARKGGE